MSIKTVTGIIIEEVPTKSINIWRYILEKKDGDSMSLVTFSNCRIMMHYKVTVRYEIQENKNSSYPTTNKIKNVKYGDLITDVNRISEILEDICLSKEGIKKIIKEHGKDSLKMIMEKKIKAGIVDAHDMEKLKSFRKTDVIRLYTDFFTKMDVTYKCEWFKKIKSVYGANIKKIKEDPYKLYMECELPFKEVDKIGVKLGLEISEMRIVALIKYLYEKFDNDGILYQRQSEIKKRCYKEKIIEDVNDPIIRFIINSLIYIIKDGIKYYTTPEQRAKEEYIENYCNSLCERKKKIKIEYDRDKLVEATNLDPKQMDSIEMVLKNNISVITGAPGTGKTYVIANICNILNSSRTLVLAPTGAAVQKLKQDIEKICKKTKPKCQTIHSYLKSEEKLYETIIIDEMSMVSMNLFYKLLKKIPNDKITRILISGDANQLPSIQGGNIMYDMMIYSNMPKIELTTQHRSKRRVINDNSKLILDGLDICPDNDIIIFKEIKKKVEIEKYLLEILSKKRYNINSENSCILIPQRKKDICTNYYNKILQEYYNSEQQILISNSTSNLKIGDKVIYKKNDYEKGVYNGSIMTVNEYRYKKMVKTDKKQKEYKYLNNEIIKKKKYVYKGDKLRKNGDQYDNKIECLYHENEEDLTEGIPKEFELDELDNIGLAYATTIHSAQGKGYETVILILHSSMFPGLLTRKLLYTALTRSKKRCIIIADQGALAKCKNEDKPRVTNLFQKNHIHECQIEKDKKCNKAE